MPNNKKIEITASQIRAYKSCRRLYELEYIDCLRPIEEYEPYAIGRNYHNKVSQIIKHGEFEKTDDKTDMMAEAFGKFIMPKLKAVKTETEFGIRLSHGIYLKGKIDGIDESGIPIEHKTTANAISDEFAEKLKWDDQIAVYMIGAGANELVYTVCQKPTIKLRQNESREDYLKRCAEWYDETKTAVLRLSRTDEELEEKKREITAIAKEIRSQKNWLRNPANCKVLSCQYSKICLGYDSEYMAGFKKKGKRNEELSI